MQTTSLQNLLNTTGAASAQRSGNAGNSNNDSAQGGASFGAMLSNEMELRQPPPVQAPAPAPGAPKADAVKPQAAAKPAQPDDAAPQQAAKTEDAAKPASADKADAEDADSEDAAADEQPAQPSDPASAMLALMASLQQPAKDAKDAKADIAAGASAKAFDALGGAAGKGKRGDAAQLATLQAALKSTGKEDSGSAGKAFADAAALSNPALAAAGAGIGADDKRPLASDAGDKAGFDPRALGLKAGQAEAQLDAAALAVQQARETEAAREPVAVAGLVQAQPTVMEAVQAAAAAADELSAQVGTEAWENQVGQKVVYMVGSDEQTASLTLNPPDLGPLQVVLSVSNDQASVTFSANQEEVRQALEDALPRLREMMSENGIALGNATVNAGMPDNRQAQEQAARNSGGFSGNGNGRGRGDNGNAADEPAARTVTRTAVLGDRGMVDTFA
jgi:flagellar hook-length control protein FliK